MFVIIFAVCVFIIGLCVCLWKTWPEKKPHGWESQRDWMFTFIFSLAYSLVAGMSIGLACVVLAPMGDGLMRGYSEGTREGYITKISERGVIWKTIECQIQVGTGEMAALQSPFDFSVPKYRKDVQEVLAQNLGKKVRINYNQWLVMPYSIGSSGYEVVSIEPVVTAQHKE